MTYRAARSPLTWLGALLALYLLLPVVAFVIRFSGSHDRGFATAGLWGAVQTSAESATISTLVITVLGVPLASWLARSSGPVAAITGVIVQLPLALPPVMSGIVLIYLVGPYTAVGRLFGGRLTDSLTGVAIAQTFVAAPFLIIAARSAFAAVDPALDDLAATLGHRPLARFWRVQLRTAAHGIRAGMLLTWLRAVGEYGATVLLAYHPYSLPVFTYVQFSSTGIPTTQAPTALALAIAALVITVNTTHWPTRLRPLADPPAPRAPQPAPRTIIGFDLNLTVGTFHLQLTHHAASHRIAILGPSGAGKSITLRALAGLLGPRTGPVSYNQRQVTDIATEARHIGYVPQHLGLFPGRTVWHQLLFATNADAQLAAWWVHTLHLDGLLDRFPHQLSGGQRQRVSLAQALVSSPRLILLDEPFSALDAPVRDDLRRELRRLQQQTGLSTVLVTHDPEEAALLADEILIIDNGQLLQAGTRAQVYNRPASAHVARLLGIANLNQAKVGSASTIATDGLDITVDDHHLPPGTDVLWCIRPEHVAFDPNGSYQATVVDVADTGTSTALTVRLVPGPTLQIRTTDAADRKAGDTCRINLNPHKITLWEQHKDEVPTGSH